LLLLLLVRNKASSIGSTAVRVEIKQPRSDKTSLETVTGTIIYDNHNVITLPYRVTIPNEDNVFQKSDYIVCCLSTLITFQNIIKTNQITIIKAITNIHINAYKKR
jgi:hypothetical protein